MNIIYIYTSCKGLLNKVYTTTINRPSLVLSNDVDIVYEIRHLLQSTKLTIIIKYAQSVRPSNEIIPTPLETLMLKMHCGASTYYTTKTVQDRPKRIPIAFPSQKNCIYHRNTPIVTNIDTF